MEDRQLVRSTPPDAALTAAWVLLPQAAVAAMTGRSVRPSAVRLYSVLGGIVENARLSMRPSPQAPSAPWTGCDR